MTDHEKSMQPESNGTSKDSKAIGNSRKRFGGDPHHPDHPRNQVKRDAIEEMAEDSSKNRNKRFGSDPHHPDHPRNRTR